MFSIFYFSHGYLVEHKCGSYKRKYSFSDICDNCAQLTKLTQKWKIDKLSFDAVVVLRCGSWSRKCFFFGGERILKPGMFQVFKPSAPNVGSSDPPPPLWDMIIANQDLLLTSTLSLVCCKDDQRCHGQEVWVVMACCCWRGIWFWDHPWSQQPALYVLWWNDGDMCLEMLIRRKTLDSVYSHVIM